MPDPANHKIGLMQRSPVNLAYGENTCKINFTRNNFIINNNLTQSVSNVVITPVIDVTITTRRTKFYQVIHWSFLIGKGRFGPWHLSFISNAGSLKKFFNPFVQKRVTHNYVILPRALPLETHMRTTNMLSARSDLFFRRREIWSLTFIKNPPSKLRPSLKMLPIGTFLKTRNHDDHVE